MWFLKNDATKQRSVKSVSVTQLFHEFFGRYSFALTVVVFAVAAFGFFFVLYSAPATKIVVSNREVLPGQLITAADLRYEVWEGRVPPDAVVDMTTVEQRRTVVNLPAGTPLREAYVKSAQSADSSGRSRIFLPVSVSVSQILTAKDRIDIYLPQVCDKSNEVCPPRLLTHDATVVQILKNDELTYGNSEATIVLDVKHNDVTNLVSVMETSLLKYILIQDQ
ncbi:MAG: hypothetical protein Q4D73_05925 [Actinomycetaceae bacterium]|nr:hypothetical protein [Actinomycetaceae bacterium]